MARLARVEVYSPEDIAIVHVMNRVVRRCFLMGMDPITNKCYDHRKRWVEDRLQLLASSFGIDLLCFAIMSNHFHLVLRSRPDVVAHWDDSEVARRWLMLCPKRKRKDGSAEIPNEAELNLIRNNALMLAKIRSRLSDIAWWMRLLCQHIATRANLEDAEVGKFWQSRYRAIRLEDEAAILSCAAYVDLNPIRAAIAELLETSDHTSIQRRIETLKAQNTTSIEESTAAGVEDRSEYHSAEVIPKKRLATKDAFLSPLTIDESRHATGPNLSTSPHRCSDKGFLPISQLDYVELLDWTARKLSKGKRGSTPTNVPSILERLGFNESVWCELVGSFGRLFNSIAGRPKTIDSTHSRKTHRRFHMRRRARELLQCQT